MAAEKQRRRGRLRNHQILEIEAAVGADELEGGQDAVDPAAVARKRQQQPLVLHRPPAAVADLVNGVDRCRPVDRAMISGQRRRARRLRHHLVEEFAAAIDRAVDLADGVAVVADQETRRPAAVLDVEQAEIGGDRLEMLGVHRLPLRHAVFAAVALPELQQPTLADRPDDVRTCDSKLHWASPLLPRRPTVRASAGLSQQRATTD